MFPKTTSLYSATVIDNTTYCRDEDDIIVVEFDGDDPDETGALPQHHIPARFVTMIPKEFSGAGAATQQANSNNNNTTAATTATSTTTQKKRKPSTGGNSTRNSKRSKEQTASSLGTSDWALDDMINGMAFNENALDTFDFGSDFEDNDK